MPKIILLTVPVLKTLSKFLEESYKNLYLQEGRVLGVVIFTPPKGSTGRKNLLLREYQGAPSVTGNFSRLVFSGNISI